MGVPHVNIHSMGTSSAIRRLVPWAVLCGIMLGIYMASTLVDQRSLESFVEGAGVWGPVVCVALFLVANIIAPVSGSPVLLAGLIIFGRTAIIYSLIATG